MGDIFLYNEAEHYVNTLNGVLNQGNLEFAKKTLLFDTVRPHTEVVSAKQHYPENDLSKVELKIDVVLMDRERYDRLIKLEKALNSQYNNSTKKEYLNFPKL
jgi:hypothetical protein